MSIWSPVTLGIICAHSDRDVSGIEGFRLELSRKLATSGLDSGSSFTPTSIAVAHHTRVAVCTFRCHAFNLGTQLEKVSLKVLGELCTAVFVQRTLVNKHLSLRRKAR